ncbi:MAG: hypothetical protein M3R30_06705 [Candidatus Eremiobacteraeota bacterium]|nr:hypothetical protein [Candidatus Eremiobacteraeota bacterium]
MAPRDRRAGRTSRRRVAPRDDGSHWYRFHLRQALWFGNLAAIAGLVALLWPLVLASFVADVGATIWIYGLALVIDSAFLVAWIVLAVRYSRRAARGEFFVIPLVARVTGSASPIP